MKLLPSLRQKKRYILFQIQADKKFSLSEVKEAVEQSLQQFLGDLGIAKAAPLFLHERFNEKKQQFVIKVNHNHLDEVKSGVILCKSIKKTFVLLNSVVVSGTLKTIDSYSK